MSPKLTWKKDGEFWTADACGLFRLYVSAITGQWEIGLFGVGNIVTCMLHKSEPKRGPFDLSDRMWSAEQWLTSRVKDAADIDQAAFEPQKFKPWAQPALSKKVPPEVTRKLIDKALHKTADRPQGQVVSDAYARLKRDYKIVVRARAASFKLDDLVSTPTVVRIPSGLIVYVDRAFGVWCELHLDDATKQALGLPPDYQLHRIPRCELEPFTPEPRYNVEILQKGASLMVGIPIRRNGTLVLAPGTVVDVVSNSEPQTGNVFVRCPASRRAFGVYMAQLIPHPEVDYGVNPYDVTRNPAFGEAPNAPRSAPTIDGPVIDESNAADKLDAHELSLHFAPGTDVCLTRDFRNEAGQRLPAGAVCELVRVLDDGNRALVRHMLHDVPMTVPTDQLAVIAR